MANTIKKKALDITSKELTKMLQKMVVSIGVANSKKFKQSIDLSIKDHVIHAEIQHLEWLYGSVYRKHKYHYFLLYNFDVNKNDLKPEHEEVLKNFIEKIKLEELLRDHKTWPREFEEHDVPYVANIKKNLKEKIIKEQPWVPKTNVSREDIIRNSILEKVLDVNSTNKWWDNDTLCFPDSNNTIKIDSSNSAGNDKDYRAFKIKNLLFWRTAPNISGQFSAFTGRASETGNDNINDPLSKKRANEVSYFLNKTLNDYLNVNYEFLITEGVGSRKPLIMTSQDLKIKNKEISENRSVQFSYYQAHDYLYINTEKELKDLYSSMMSGVKILLNNNIKYCEEHISNTKDPFHIPHKYNVIENGILEADVQFSLGIKGIEFAKSYQGDFDELNKPEFAAHIPNSSNNLFLQHFPEHTNTSHHIILPLALLLVQGNPKANKYKKPLNISDRLLYSSRVYLDIRKFIHNELRSMGETWTPHLHRAQYLMKFYDSSLKNELQLASFIFKKYPEKDRNKYMENSNYELDVDFSNEKNIYTEDSVLKSYLNKKILKLNIIDNDGEIIRNFVGLMDNKKEVEDFYWYDQNIILTHRFKKEQIALELFKLYALTSFKDIPSGVFGGFDSSILDTLSPRYNISAMTYLSHCWIFP